MKRLLLTLHRWLGLTTGIVLLAIGASGSILVYRHPIDRLLYPELYAEGPAGPRLPVDSLYAIVYARHGGEFSSVSFDLPVRGDEPVEFTFTSPGVPPYGMRHYIVDLHPHTGAIVREGDCDNISTSAVHWMMYLHDGALFGNFGMLAVALCALSMLASAVTGIIFYGKKITAILTFARPLRGLRGPQFLRSLHVYISVWSLLFTLVVFFTGLWMVRGIFTGGRWSSPAPQGARRIAVSIDGCITASSRALPGFSPDFVDLPLRDKGVIEIDGDMGRESFVRGGDASSVTFDPQSGALLGTVDERKAAFPQNIVPAFWALHTGSYGGAIVRMLYAIFGLVPGVLSLSGFIMWKSGGPAR